MQLTFLVIFTIAGIILFSSMQDSAAEESIKISIAQGSSVLGCDARDLCYIPNPIIVNMTDVVEWVNQDSEPHTVTSGTPESGPDGIIYSAVMQPGEVFAFSFDESGAFSYYCTLHPWMEGIIVANPLRLESTSLYEIEQMRLSESGSVIGTIQTDKPQALKELEIELKFTDEKNSILVHMNYDIRIIQDNEDVLLNENAHSVDGYAELRTEILESDNPVEIIIGIRGIYLASESEKLVSETITFLVSDETSVKKGVSPKAQMKSGVNSYDVICRQGFELMIKNSDKSAACVTLDSIGKLIVRGWGNLV